MLVASPHKPTLPGRSPAAVWDPAHPNQVTLTNGASIAGDRPSGDVRLWEPPIPPGCSGIGIAATVHSGRLSSGIPDGDGIFLQDNHGDTYRGVWS